MTIKNFQNIQV